MYKTCPKNVEKDKDHRPSICFVDIALDFELLAFVSDFIVSHSELASTVSQILMFQIKKAKWKFLSGIWWQTDINMEMLVFSGLHNFTILGEFVAMSKVAQLFCVWHTASFSLLLSSPWDPIWYCWKGKCLLMFNSPNLVQKSKNSISNNFNSSIKNTSEFIFRKPTSDIKKKKNVFGGSKTSETLLHLFLLSWYNTASWCWFFGLFEGSHVVYSSYSSWPCEWSLAHELFSPVTGYGELPGSRDEEPHVLEHFYCSALEPMFVIPVAGLESIGKQLDCVMSKC